MQNCLITDSYPACSMSTSQKSANLEGLFGELLEADADLLDHLHPHLDRFCHLLLQSDNRARYHVSISSCLRRQRAELILAESTHKNMPKFGL